MRRWRAIMALMRHRLLLLILVLYLLLQILLEARG